MTEPLKVVPHDKAVKTGVTDPSKVAESLAGSLADTYRLLFKTHAYHWNVEGPLFYSIHMLTEEQYEDMFEAADEMAERMRALGQLAPHTLAEMEKLSCIKDTAKLPDAANMVEELAGDHQAVAKRLHDVAEVAEDAKDIVTADLVTARAAFHEKAAWMLRATVAQ
ncbi:Dps family protein [Frigidibacter oleivorans]|uniref:Dps family protein n=1 Tax=Frigidibacter oleivorans TaxID=2487129 RepID=UPI000F8CFCA8|nr:DNA starvation/stationary phase protection protein [Frigidibacter oleivorans]